MQVAIILAHGSMLRANIIFEKVGLNNLVLPSIPYAVAESEEENIKKITDNIGFSGQLKPSIYPKGRFVGPGKNFRVYLLETKFDIEKLNPKFVNIEMSHVYQAFLGTNIVKDDDGNFFELTSFTKEIMMYFLENNDTIKEYLVKNGWFRKNKLKEPAYPYDRHTGIRQIGPGALHGMPALMPKADLVIREKQDIATSSPIPPAGASRAGPVLRESLRGVSTAPPVPPVGASKAGPVLRASLQRKQEAIASPLIRESPSAAKPDLARLAELSKYPPSEKEIAYGIRRK